VVYGLLVLPAGIPQGAEAFTLIAVCIAVSITAHSSMDVPIARMFHVDDLAGIPDDGGAEQQPHRTARRTVILARDLAEPCPLVTVDNHSLITGHGHVNSMGAVTAARPLEHPIGAS
jgi:hypothetical protein